MDEWDGNERRLNHNESGFAISSWSNLASFLSVCLMAVAGIAWGLKLESKIDKYSDMQSSMRERFLADIATTQAVIARGMLPVTEVKLEAIDKRLDGLERDVEACVRKNKLSIPYAEKSVEPNTMRQ